jgi:hypothetical protein
MTFMMKSRVDYIQEMCAIIQSKIFVFPSHIKNLKIKIYKTVILLIVLYGGETWSLTLREEHRLRVFEKRVLRIFGPKREEDRLWRELHNDELHSLRMRWAGHVACMGRGEVFPGFWLGGPKVRDHWKDLGIGGKITLC